MSIPALSYILSPPSLPVPRPERRYPYRNITQITIFGGTVGTVLIIASATILSFSLLIAGFAVYGLTALVGISSFHHNFKILSKNVRENLRDLENEVFELPNLMPRLGERIAVLEKEFLNRGRYKYIDETPEGPPPAPSSPKSPALSSEAIPK